MSRKAIPTFFNGEKYVMMSNLSAAQVALFASWVSDSLYHPKEDEFGGHEMVPYRRYEYWYDQYFHVAEDQDQLI